jgi:hypothetical protein
MAASDRKENIAKAPARERRARVVVRIVPWMTERDRLEAGPALPTIHELAFVPGPDVLQ